ncbi:LysM repeat protein [Desulfohalotomaculum tongense]|uniref:LysM peptidoglycan-binding domain-containing protein n=1 Tax=Desulforadius tongensis TaxID=1216062 RepID=UPI00195CCD50|nr:LysM domain-containing protein [Desulforadius tongensis]MBM7854556.1 LysM repeat protein [Desulforadius tongensis]
MKNNNSMEIKGKTVSQLEKHFIENHKKRLKWQGILTALLAGGVCLFVMMWMWNLGQELTALRLEVERLAVENAALRKEIVSIKTQNTTAEKHLDGEGEYIYHHIQSGDSFAAISKRYYGTEVYASQLARINGIPAAARLHLGQVIKVPREPYEWWKS